jgi:hypothetical protein
MAKQIRGDWMDNGFICNIAPRFALIDVVDGKIYDTEFGYALEIDGDEITGWPCHTFSPDKGELDRLKSAMSS